MFLRFMKKDNIWIGLEVFLTNGNYLDNIPANKIRIDVYRQNEIAINCY